MNVQTEIYFNTTNLRGQTLRKQTSKAGAQKLRVYEFFRDRQKAAYTPCQVWTELQKVGEKCPLTSIRRAITTLTKQGLLQKLDTMRVGIYGNLVHTWTLRA